MSSSGLPDIDTISFYGYDGCEAEDFVRLVRKYIKHHGKRGDNEWIRSEIEPCFAEEALRWHSALENDIKMDWEALEKALFTRFPSPEVRESAYKIRQITPDAPAAPPLKPTTNVGIIKVDSTVAGRGGYVGKVLSSRGWLQVVDQASEAMSVEFMTSGNAQKLQINNGGTDCIGFQWSAAVTWKDGDNSLYGAVGSFGQDSTSFIGGTSLSGPKSPLASWIISRSQNSIEPIWAEGTTAGRQLCLFINTTPERELFVSWDNSSFGKGSGGFAKASLIFEAK